MTESFKEPREIVLTVSELTSALKMQIEPVFRNISVRGEISNFKAQASGHIYFSLKEKECLIQCVIFRSYVTKEIQRLTDGKEVVAIGEITIYAPRGSYQLVVRSLTPAGVGLELLQLEALKKKLLQQGFFQLERKKRLPNEWKTLCVITSPTGAVLRDIFSVLKRRMGNSFHLLIYPVRVQGDMAAKEIATAIREVNKYRSADILIVCRGGGAADELSCFNTEEVAQACFESTLPIVSAVGHETDTTIIDLVADIRAATPSVAAEMVSQLWVETNDKLKQFKKILTQKIATTLLSHQHRYKEKQKAFQLSYTPQKLIEFYAQRLDDIAIEASSRIERNLDVLQRSLRLQKALLERRHPYTIFAVQKSAAAECMQKIEKRLRQILSDHHAALPLLSSRIVTSESRIVQARRKQLVNFRPNERLISSLRRLFMYTQHKLTTLTTALRRSNPYAPLERGYAFVFHENSPQLVHSIGSLRKDEHVTMMFRDGTAQAHITNISPKGEQT